MKPGPKHYSETFFYSEPYSEAASSQPTFPSIPPALQFLFFENPTVNSFIKRENVSVGGGVGWGGKDF